MSLSPTAMNLIEGSTARIGRCVRTAAHPVAPDLVAYLPVLHAVRLGVAVAGAHRAVFRSRRGVAVFHPRRGLFDRRPAPFDVDRDRRLRADVAAEADELVRAEIARLRLILP